ncbi:sideroflexin-5, variant [Capsaspora owczarzaki ATCC 30864]|uniref:Sidoreflexin n=1 Tax=Capsaspora owczarzaki (strain ATCC 30864) TaxID=595528 RepID=A0A0D2VS87_CAPO3|nr:sideroflexin-5, variant [Capsaspora owczarzaki ATCC 30864]
MRYDQSAFSGRVRHFFDLVDPMLLLTSDAKLKESVDLLAAFKAGKINPGQPGQVTDAQMWEARRIKEAILHPDTNEPIPAVFRMSAFVPANVPIIAGMLMSPPTVLNTVMWQWINQTFNAGFNYSNRNANAPQSTAEIATAYGAASAISVGTAVGLGELVKRATNLPPAVRGVVRTVVPFVAVASAGVANMYLMRRGEAETGIDVRDSEGNLVGRSQEAGKICLKQVAVTRVLLPVPILILPPVIMSGLNRTAFLKSNPRVRMAVEVGVIAGAIWGALPLAIATFPQVMPVETSKLETRFHQMRTPKGDPITTLYYNKGV